MSSQWRGRRRVKHAPRGCGERTETCVAGCVSARPWEARTARPDGSVKRTGAAKPRQETNAVERKPTAAEGVREDERRREGDVVVAGELLTGLAQERAIVGRMLRKTRGC